MLRDNGIADTRSIGPGRITGSGRTSVMVQGRDEALLHMTRALAILDRGAPSPIACHLQTAIDLLIEDSVAAGFPADHGMRGTRPH